MFSLPRYHRVSQEADSGDEEVTVFELPRLRGTDFGGGVYNKDADLDLPRVNMLRPPKPYSKTQSVATVCAFILVLLVVIGAAVGLIVYGSRYENPRRLPIKVSLQPALTKQSSLIQPSTQHTKASTPLLPENDTPPTTSSLGGTHHTTSPKSTPLPPENGTPSGTLTTSSVVGTQHVKTSLMKAQPTPLLPESETVTPTFHTTYPTNAHSTPLPGGNETPPTTSSVGGTQHATSPTTSPHSTPPPGGNETTVQNSTGIAATHNNSSQPLPCNETSTESVTDQPPSTAETTPGGPRKGISWQREFFPALTESTIQLYDMNRDGTLDVVVVDGFSNCAVRIVALDGSNGETVWEHNVTFEVFAVKCELDVNSDEIMDCLVSGRYSGFAALSGLDGSMLWSVDPSIAYPRYNFYFPLIVQDLDGDGTKDLINVHGGDSSYSDSQTNRSPAFMVVVSGRTGQKLMPRIPVPDGHESYMTPVLHTFAGGVETILFGSGGETIPGSLWAVTFDSIKAQVQDYTSSSEEYAQENIFTDYTNHPCSSDLDYHTLEDMRPTFDPSDFDANNTLPECPLVGDRQSIWNSYNVCVYELYRAVYKGMILPPVIVEMTGDGHKDIVAVSFDGHVLLLDGKTASIVWDKYTPDSESYSVPAPLYYNNDSTIDLLVRVNVGTWMVYNYSYVAVLDGRDGHELWTLDSVSTGMMSGLSLAAAAGSPDAMVFITVGRESPKDIGGILGDMLGKGFSKRSSDDRTCHVYFDDLCLWDDRGREKRHGGGKQDGEEEGGMDYDVDFIQETLKNNDPPDLWAPGPYPDPATHLEAFLHDCGHSTDELSEYFYFLTRDVIERGGGVRALEEHRPYVYQYPERVTRHSSHNHHHDDDTPDYKDLRCSHIEAPAMIPPTPAIADFDGDGRLEVAYIILWGTLSNEVSLLPPRMAVKVFTIEEQFTEVYGRDVVDFSQFLPMDQQPWTRYMGARGDNVYRRLHRNTN